MDDKLIAIVGNDEILKLHAYKSLKNCINLRFDHNSPGQTLLHMAAFHNAHRCIRYLIEHTHPQMDVNAVTVNGATPLIVAVCKNNLECVNVLVEYVKERHVDLYAYAAFCGVTALQRAAVAGNVDIVKALLAVMDEKKVSTDDADGDTILYSVARDGHSEVLRLLACLPGINFDAKMPSSSVTPLLVALHEDRFACVEILLAHESTNVNCACTPDGLFPLFVAIDRNRRAAFHLLIAHARIDVRRKLPSIVCADNRLDAATSTVLQYAILREQNHWAVEALLKHPDIQVDLPMPRDHCVHHPFPSELFSAVHQKWSTIVKLLCAVPRVDVNRIDANSRTPLHMAMCLMPDADVVAALLGRDDLHVNIMTEDSSSPLHQATQDGHAAVIAAMLTRRDLDVNLLSNMGTTILHVALAADNLDIVKMLLTDMRTNVNICADNGFPPLCLAITWERMESVRLLLLHPEIDVSRSVKGQPMLIYAVCVGNVQLVRWLLAMPASQVDVNEPTASPLRYHEPALTFAAHQGHNDIVAELLKCSLIDATIVDDHGLTALHHAKNETIGNMIQAHLNECEEFERRLTVTAGHITIDFR